MILHVCLKNVDKRDRKCKYLTKLTPFFVNVCDSFDIKNTNDIFLLEEFEKLLHRDAIVKLF